MFPPGTSGIQDNAAGLLSLAGSTGTDPETVDASGTPSGTFVYVQTGANGIVDEYQVAPGGSLTEMGSVVVAGAVGGEGKESWPSEPFAPGAAYLLRDVRCRPRP